MSSGKPASKERIRQSLDVLEKWYDPKTGKIDGHGMMHHIIELEAKCDRLAAENAELQEKNKRMYSALQKIAFGQIPGPEHNAFWTCVELATQAIEGEEVVEDVGGEG